jgi:hypothetical protein
LDLVGLRALGPGVALALSSHDGGLSLNGIDSLSAQEGGHLAATTGELRLDSLKAIDDALGEHLGEHVGELSLKGVSEMSDKAAVFLAGRETAPALGDFIVNHFYWSELSQGKASLLSRYRMDLDLDRLTSLTDEAAGELGAHVGKLSLNGLSDLSADAAEGLANHQGYWRVSLDGLKEIRVKVAAALAKHPGKLTLNGLVELSDRVAEKLVAHEGWAMELNGLAHLSDSAATILASRKSPWNLSLHGLEALSEFSRGALSAVPGVSLSQAARKRSS